MIKKEGISKKSLTKAELEKALIDNFINLQKVLTNLSVKFEDLSTNMSKLLQLFEISAKSFTEKYSEKEEKPEINKNDKQLLTKLDSLLNQNKTIARGILLMENRIKQRANPRQKEPDRFGFSKSRPLPRI